MGAIIRMILSLLVAVVVAAALVLMITSRQVKDAEVAPAYAALAAQDQAARVQGTGGVRLAQPKPIVRVVQWAAETLDLGHKVAGVRVPPPWLMSLAVAWDRANMPSWWWLPLLILGVRYLLGGFAHRRIRVK